MFTPNPWQALFLTDPLNPGLVSWMESQEDCFRRTGRTTVLAHHYIRQAALNPGSPVKIVDHYPTRDSNRMLAGVIRELLKDAGVSSPTVMQYPSGWYLKA